MTKRYAECKEMGTAILAAL